MSGAMISESGGRRADPVRARHLAFWRGAPRREPSLESCAPAALAGELTSDLARGPGFAILQLAARHPGETLPPSVAFFRDVGALFLARACAAPMPPPTRRHLTSWPGWSRRRRPWEAANTCARRHWKHSGATWTSPCAASCETPPSSNGSRTVTPPGTWSVAYASTLRRTRPTRNGPSRSWPPIRRACRAGPSRSTGPSDRPCATLPPTRAPSCPSCSPCSALRKERPGQGAGRRREGVPHAGLDTRRGAPVPA